MALTLHSYFDEAVARRPAAPALAHNERIWSYRELRTLVDGVREAIAGQRLDSAGQTIGVLCEKGPAAYASLLAVMTSGSVYVPLTSRSPVERLAKTMRLARMRALIVDRAHAGTAAALLASPGVGAVPVIVADSVHPPELLAPHPARAALSSNGTPADEALAADARAGDAHAGNARIGDGALAYVMFTSGSTGVPKGVPVTHANAAACIEAVSSRLAFRETDRFTQFSDLAFDVSIGEMFLCWKHAACLLVPSFADRLRPVDFVNRCGATVWGSVPTLAHNANELRPLQPGDLPTLRHSLFAGEALPAPLARLWQAAAPASTVANLYGPTEASIFTTLYICSGETAWERSTVPIGWPLPGFSYRIHRHDDDDADGNGGGGGGGGGRANGNRDAGARAPDAGDLAGAGADAAPGELWLSGPQVVSGYWCNDAATAASFVTARADDEERRTWYRTGDAVSLDPRHGLLFHGRLDHQIKVKGHRVELQEVENLLERITGSGRVAVVPVLAADGRCESLVAFVQSMAADEDQVRDLCRRSVPDYMLPRRIVARAALPVNSNGKVDYATLSAEAAVLAR